MSSITIFFLTLFINLSFILLMSSFRPLFSFFLPFSITLLFDFYFFPFSLNSFLPYSLHQFLLVSLFPFLVLLLPRSFLPFSFLELFLFSLTFTFSHYSSITSNIPFLFISLSFFPSFPSLLSVLFLLFCFPFFLRYYFV